MLPNEGHEHGGCEGPGQLSRGQRRQHPDRWRHGPAPPCRFHGCRHHRPPQGDGAHPSAKPVEAMAQGPASLFRPAEHLRWRQRTLPLTRVPCRQRIPARHRPAPVRPRGGPGAALRRKQDHELNRLPRLKSSSPPWKPCQPGPGGASCSASADPRAVRQRRCHEVRGPRTAEPEAARRRRRGGFAAVCPAWMPSATSTGCTGWVWSNGAAPETASSTIPAASSPVPACNGRRVQHRKTEARATGYGPKRRTQGYEQHLSTKPFLISIPPTRRRRSSTAGKPFWQPSARKSASTNNWPFASPGGFAGGGRPPGRRLRRDCVVPSIALGIALDGENEGKNRARTYGRGARTVPRVPGPPRRRGCAGT